MWRRQQESGILTAQLLFILGRRAQSATEASFFWLLRTEDDAAARDLHLPMMCLEGKKKPVI